MTGMGLAQAQNAWDGMRFSQNFYGGTARFTAMGGAFAALGDDFSALSINPAGIGVYRSMEASITPAISYRVTDASYLGNTTKDTYTRFGLDNLGFTFNVFNNYESDETIRINMGIGYNKLNQQVAHISASGISEDHTNQTLGSIVAAIAADSYGTDASVLDLKGNDAFYRSGKWASVLAWRAGLIDVDPTSSRTDEYIGATEGIDYFNGEKFFYMEGPVRQNYYKEEYGSTGEYLLSFGGNIFNQFYFGLNFGIQSIWNSRYESFTEKAINNSDFETGFNYMTYQSDVTTRGTGYNIKLGVIWRPVAGLRWGAYFHSPTWMYLTDDYSYRMVSDFVATSNNPSYHANELSPSGTFDYRINTPIKWGTGLAYVFSKVAISAEYEGMDYGATKMLSYDGRRYTKMPYNGYDPEYQYEDDYTKRNFGIVSNFRVGAEVVLMPLSVRLGYAYYGSPVKNDNSYARNVFSAGLGYRIKNFYIDGAYSFTPDNRENSMLYTNSPDMYTNSFGGKINLTLGFRF